MAAAAAAASALERPIKRVSQAAVSAPVTTSPADNSSVDLTNVTFTWTSVAGADVYSVQVSADPTNPGSYQPVAQYINPSKSGGQSISRTVDLSNRFAGRALLAWRVGARNSQDQTPPLGGYVFSDIKSIIPQQAGAASVILRQAAKGSKH